MPQAFIPPPDGTQGAPYWNNYQTAGNIGQFLASNTPNGGIYSGEQANAPGGFYLANRYLAAGNTGLCSAAPPRNFYFRKIVNQISAELLLASAGQNNGPFGTEIGVYNRSNPNDKTVLWTAGSLANASGGSDFTYNSNVGAAPALAVPGGLATRTISVANLTGSVPSFGFYAKTCLNPIAGTGCHVFYSDSALSNHPSDVTQPNDFEPGYPIPFYRQHWSLFTYQSDPTIYYIGFEDWFGDHANEAAGDFNDIVIRLNLAPPSPCTGGDMVCGYVRSAESNTVVLKNVPVELRNQDGGLLLTRHTNASGYYGFTGVPTGRQYIVNVVADRLQAPNPIKRVLPTLPATGSGDNDFEIRGWPAIITVTGKPGSTVLLSAGQAYTNPLTPRYDYTEVNLSNTALKKRYLMATLDQSGKTKMSVPGHSPYYLTCWKPVKQANGSTSYQRSSTNPPVRSANAMIEPGDTNDIIACP